VSRRGVSSSPGGDERGEADAADAAHGGATGDRAGQRVRTTVVADRVADPPFFSCVWVAGVADRRQTVRQYLANWSPIPHGIGLSCRYDPVDASNRGL